MEGIEPSTSFLSGTRSTTELHARILYKSIFYYLINIVPSL